MLEPSLREAWNAPYEGQVRQIVVDRHEPEMCLGTKFLIRQTYYIHPHSGNEVRCPAWEVWLQNGVCWGMFGEDTLLQDSRPIL